MSDEYKDVCRKVTDCIIHVLGTKDFMVMHRDGRAALSPQRERRLAAWERRTGYKF